MGLNSAVLPRLDPTLKTPSMLSLEKPGRGIPEGSSYDVPRPPYNLKTIRIVSIGGTFEPSLGRRLMLGGLEPTADCSGGFLAYAADHGWGIAPYTAFFLWLDVEGHDSESGAKGRLIRLGWFSDRAGTAFHTFFNRNITHGRSYERHDGDAIIATAGPGESQTLRMTIRPFGPAVPYVGVHNYFGEDEAGGLNLYSASFTFPVMEAEPVGVTLLGAVPHLMAEALEGFRQSWAYYTPDGTLTIGEPRKLAADPTAIADAQARLSFLHLFSTLGRAAILCEEGGRVVGANIGAERHLGRALNVTSGRLTAAQPDDQRLLSRVLSAALSGGDRLGLEAVAIRRPDAETPLLIQALPVTTMLGRATSAVVLVTDPEDPARTEVAQALQLLGLTPAEAKVAAAVGSGLSPRETAAAVGNTEKTVRQTLSQVYSKLGIRRQSELAKIVGRLELVEAASRATA